MKNEVNNNHFLTHCLSIKPIIKPTIIPQALAIALAAHNLWVKHKINIKIIPYLELNFFYFVSYKYDPLRLINDITPIATGKIKVYSSIKSP